ncbi:MAG: SusC/RagA family TonB-linked outer membrane protein, partial [Bacteroidales bacterium]|nr:SusC/RagA family TonB-linked outer membrane protein [Bacteroidales bacterium]
MRKLLTIILVSFCAVSAFAQSVTVTGTVSDKFGPIIGASVFVVENNTIGVITDENGRYSINVPSPENSLVFSFIGYDSVTEAVGNRRTINVEFSESATRLEDVVVIGYGSTTVKNLTSSVSSVKTEDIDNTAIASVDNMLLGRVAGLNMTSNSAQPGASVDVNIRGSISPNGNNEPLYVIDGVPMTSNTANIAATTGNGAASLATGLSQSPLNTINPSDIVSIDVLKDASAAAIYGSASANGVIIITTRRGQEGKPRVTYSGNYTFQVQKPYKEKLMDSKTFMETHNFWIHERVPYTANTYPYGKVDYNGDGVVDINDYNDAFNSTSDMFSAQQIASASNTDWLDYVTDNAYITEHNVSMSGGSGGTRYFASYNYYLNDGILKGSRMARNSVRVNLDQKIGERINLGLNINYTNIGTNNQSSGTSSVIGIGTASLMQNAYGFPPFGSTTVDPELGFYPHAIDGQQTNPAGQLQITDKNKNNRIFINPTLTIDITRDLNFKLVGGYDTQTSRRDYYIPRITGN